MGSGSDERYNMSAIVANSYEIGKSYVRHNEGNLSNAYGLRQTLHRCFIQLPSFWMGLLEFSGGR
jgi:hypothetical protein